MSIDSLLAFFPLDTHPITENDKGLLKAWLLEIFNERDKTRTQEWDMKGIDEALKSNRFDGTWHCETLHMALHQLATTSLDTYVEVAEEPSLIKQWDESLRLPELEIIERLKHVRSLLVVSKRCCPACTVLVGSLDNRFIYSGSHVIWSAVALPP